MISKVYDLAENAKKSAKKRRIVRSGLILSFLSISILLTIFASLNSQLSFGFSEVFLL